LQCAVPGVWLDQRYATRRNVTGSPIYPDSLPCLLHQDTAVKLTTAQHLLARHGYQLKIWDAYRPPESHLILWEKFGASGYVHQPGFEGRWSHHCYGRAVDVTLLDHNGKELTMPSGFDDFSPHAWAAYLHGDPTIAARLHTLQSAMVEAGFTLLDSEWWHFSDPGTAPLGPPVFARDLGL
jgi:D-alanyl-D-alanine dipeptidase